MNKVQELTSVFVYGTLKKGHYNNYLLEGAGYIGEAETSDLFCMKSLGGFPAVSITEKVSTIKGEIYSVNPKILSRLHTLEGYTGGDDTWYDAKYVDTSRGEALMYHMETDGEVISDGVWT